MLRGNNWVTINREGGKNIDNQGNTVLTNLLNFVPYTDLVVTSGNLGSILLGNDDMTKKLRWHKNIGKRVEALNVPCKTSEISLSKGNPKLLIDHEREDSVIRKNNFDPNKILNSKKSSFVCFKRTRIC